jgi:hypothetical protein
MDHALPSRIIMASGASCLCARLAQVMPQHRPVLGVIERMEQKG